MHRSKRFLWIAVSSLALAAVASAQPSEHSAVRYVRASGNANVSVKPDQAEIDIGVVSQAPTAKAAAAANAQETTKVLDQLKKLLGAEADIRTINYSVFPQYRSDDGGRKPQITGYNANNTVHVKLTDLAKVGDLIDAATQSGANQINGIQFSLSDEQGAHEKALEQATKKAMASAQAMAAAAGAKLGKLHSIEEQGSGPIQPFRGVAMAAMEKSMPTPVEPGNIEIPAMVTVTIQLE